MWTAQVDAPPLQVHRLRRVPLPFGLFFLLAIRMHTSSPSRQMIVCSWAAPAEFGHALHISSACHKDEACMCIMYSIQQRLMYVPLTVNVRGRCMILAIASRTAFLLSRGARPSPCFPRPSFKGRRCGSSAIYSNQKTGNVLADEVLPT